MNKTQNLVTLTLTASGALLAGLAGDARSQEPSAAAPVPVPASLSIDVGKPGSLTLPRYGVNVYEFRTK